MVDAKKHASLEIDSKAKWEVFIAQVNGNVNFIKQTALEVLSNYQESVEGKLEEIDEVQKENLDQFKEQSKSDFSNFSESITTLARDSLEALQAKINALLIVSDMFSKNMESQLGDGTSTLMQDGIAITKKFSSDINTDEKNFLKKMGDLVKPINAKAKDLPAMVAKIQDELKLREKSFNDKVTESSGQVIAKLQQLPQTLSNNISKVSNDWNARITEELNSTRGSISQSFEFSLEDFNSSTKNSIDHLLEKVPKPLKRSASGYRD